MSRAETPVSKRPPSVPSSLVFFLLELPVFPMKFYLSALYINKRGRSCLTYIGTEWRFLAGEKLRKCVRLVQRRFFLQLETEPTSAIAG